MVIYQCDRCKKGYAKVTDLFRVSLEKRKYNDAPMVKCFMYIDEDNHPPYYDICNSCLAELERKFYDYIEG